MPLLFPLRSLLLLIILTRLAVRSYTVPPCSLPTLQNFSTTTATAAQQQRPLQWLNEELVNMHEGRTPPFTSVTSPDALAQRKMERNGKNLSHGCCTEPIQ
ncbi:hypothetical protein OYC64_000357 [Pagothenia borchgrevinki]|uniref:Secreted protein n=1 Tax=Pagothenia borchgrevinki TaxID=8213 RepID=A0ABD2HE54_PAGBO